MAEQIKYLADTLIKNQGAKFKQLSPSLLSGKSGIALTYLLLGKYYDSKYSDLGFDILDSCIQDVNEGNINTITFCDGLSGFGSLLTLLNKEGILEDSDVEFDMKEFFLHSAQVAFENGHTDFLHGGFGILNYLASSITSFSEEDAKKIHEMITSQMVSSVEGIRFHNTVLRESQPGEFNMSLSHGLAGQILIINKIRKAIHNPLFKNLTLESIKFLQGLELLPSAERNSRFPGAIIDHKDLGNSINQRFYIQRVGWCYGDLNAAIAFLVTGKDLGNRELYDKGIEVALSTLDKRDLKSAHIKDPFFCHGTSGLAHIYRKIFALTGEERFESGAQHWDRYTKKYIASLEFSETNSFSIIEGIPGLILAELYRINPEAESWDQFFLLNHA